MQQLKQVQRQKKQQQEQQKLKQVSQNRQRQQKRKREEELLKKRQTQKQLIKRHQSAYTDFQQKIYHPPTAKQQPLTLYHRFQSQQLKKLKQQKQKLYKSFDKSQLDCHEKTYIESVQKRNQQRYKRMEEIKQIEQIQNQKSRVKFRSSFKFEKPQQQYEKRKKQDYLQAKEIRDRITSYREKVKSDFVPEIDPLKKNQLLKLMQDLQMTKKGQYRKKVMKDGQVVMERIDVKDPREVGLNYLEDVKKEVAKMRAMKRQNNDSSLMESNVQQDQKLKKPIDYLKLMRQSKSKSTSGFTSPRKTAFGNTKSSQISFQEKMRKIEDMTTKLMQKTKQEEMLLKYGKFKTSEQILSKKEIIDRNYIELLNMKLEMIERQEGR